MRGHLWTFLLTLTLVSSGSFSLINDFSERTATHCSNTDFSKLIPTSDAARAQEVASFSNPYKISLQNLIRMTTDGFNTAYFEGVSAFALAMTIIFIIFSAASLVLFVVFFFWCKGCPVRNGTGLKVISGIGIFLSFVLICLTIALWVLSGRAVRSFKDVQCATAVIPDSALNGMHKNGLKFAGLNSIASTFSAISSELPNLNYLAPQLSTAKSTAWLDDASRLLASLPMFYSVQSQVKIQNGLGSDEAPGTALSLNQNITDAIGVQSAFMANTLKYLNDSVTVSSYYTSVGTAKVSAAISLVASNMRSISDTITDTANSFVERFDFFIKAGKTGSIVTIVVVVFILVLVIAQAVFIFFLVFTAKCSERKIISKWILAVTGLAGLILSIFTLMVLINAFASGSVCEGISTLLALPSFQTFVTENNLKVGSVSATTGINGLVALFDNCVIQGATGKIGPIFESSTGNTSVFTDLVAMINGFKHFNQNREILRPASASQASSMQDLSSSLDPLRSGAKFDFTATSGALLAFNTAVACSQVTYAFNTDSCVGCQLITSSSSFTAPDCLTNKAAATTMYNNLQKYIAQEVAMIDRFREDLGMVASSPVYTPSKLYATAYSDISSNAATLDLGLFAIKDTVASVNSIEEDYITSTSCLVFRNQIQLLQGAYCLDSNQNSAAFFVVLIVTVSLLFTFNGLMYIALRCLGESDEPLSLRAKDDEPDREVREIKSNQVASDKELAKPEDT